MSFAKEASKLLTNKYFLYFIVFLAATNMLGYLVTNKLNALIFFALVSLITFQFSKNMAVVLLVAIIATNFLMSNKLIREGLENKSNTDASTIDASTIDASTNDASTNDASTNDASTNDAPTNDASTNDASNPTNNSIVNNKSNRASKPPLADTNNPELNINKEDNDVEGFGEKFANNKKSGNDSKVTPRIDYASTIDASYKQLDELLGSDSIKQLTSDTQKLMLQQQNLFNTMNQMAPVLEGATTMLKTFDINKLTDSLKSISSLKNTPTVVKNN
jgi:hypothetical protein